MKKTLFFAAIAAFALSSCSKDEAVDASKREGSGEALVFRTTLNKNETETKTTLISDNSMSNFTLNAKRWTPNTSGSGVAGFDFMDFFSAVWNPNTTLYEYRPVKYYPTDVNDGISFFAYCPAGSKNASKMTAIAGTTGKDAKASLDYTVPVKFLSSGNHPEDFIVGAVKQKLGKVNIDFSHVLSSVSFQARNKSTDAIFVVYAVRFLKLDNFATLTLTPGDVTADVANTKGTYTWTNNGTINTERTNIYEASMPVAGVTLLPTKITNDTELKPFIVNLTSDNEQLIVLPQALKYDLDAKPIRVPEGGKGDENTTTANATNNSDNSTGVDFTTITHVAMTYSVFDGDMKVVRDRFIDYIPFTTPLTFGPNKKYIISYTINASSAEAITFDKVKSLPWDGSVNQIDF